MRQAIAEYLEPRRLLAATPALIFLPPRLQSVHAGVDAAFSLGRLKAIDTAGPFTVEVNWNDGSADAVVAATKPGVLPRSSQAFDATGIQTVDVSLKNSQGLTAAGEFKIRVLPATGGIVGTVFRDVTGILRGPPLRGYTFYLDLKQDRQLDAGDPTAVSNAKGVYRFTGLVPGAYQVEESFGPQVQLASPTTGSDQVTVSLRIAKAAPFVDIVPSSTVAANVVLKTVATLGGANPSPVDVEAMQVDADGNIYVAASGGVIDPMIEAPSGTLFRIPAGASQLQLPTGLDWYFDDTGFTDGLELDGSGGLYVNSNDSFGDDLEEPTSLLKTSDGSAVSSYLLDFASLPIFDSQGNAYVAEENAFGLNTAAGGSVIEIPANTSTTETIASFNSSNPMNLAQDAAGNLYGELLDNTYTDYDEDGSAQSLFEVAAGSHALTTLYTFPTNEYADFQVTDMVSDSRGDLFATTEDSNNSTGMIFELPAGSSTITQLASFGSVPSPDLTFDPSGNLFGEVPSGGADKEGEIYEIPAGTSALSDIFTFDGSNGHAPDGLIIDTAGNLFGITSTGGEFNRGTAFRIASETLDFTTLVNFDTPDGYGPSIGLYADASGNLYGATNHGGQYGAGTIFKVSGAGFVPAYRPPGAITGEVSAAGKPLTDVTVFIDSNGTGKLEPNDPSTTTDPNGNFSFDGLSPGKYILQVVPPEGYQLNAPISGFYDLTVDNNTDSGENFSLLQGTLTNLVPANQGTIVTLHNFNGSDGSLPTSGLVADAAGNLYGTTALVGNTSPSGSIFKIAVGTLAFTTLVTLSDIDPIGSLVIDSKGNLFSGTGGEQLIELPAGATATTTVPIEIYTSFYFDGGLIRDSAGNFYVASGGLYEIAANTDVQSSFDVGSSDDNQSINVGIPAIDAAGDIFVTTANNSTGTIYEIPAGTGTASAIFSFAASGVTDADCNLVADNHGDLFGAASSYGYGSIFEIRDVGFVTSG